MHTVFVLLMIHVVVLMDMVGRDAQNQVRIIIIHIGIFLLSFILLSFTLYAAKLTGGDQYACVIESRDHLKR